MTTIDTPLRDQVRELIERAAENGETIGRPALARQLGVTEYQVRKALAELDSEPAADEDQEPADRQPGEHQTPTAASPPPEPASRPLVLWPVNTGQRLAAVTDRMTATLESAESPAVRQETASETPTGHAGASLPRPWPLALIGLAAAVAVWSGWVGLGKMAGFGLIEPLPGIANGFTIDSAIVLPISVEAYAAYALRVWLAAGWRSDRTIQFARTSAIASLVIGGAAQVAYHLMAAAGYDRAPWWVTVLVSLVPVAVLGLASALAYLVNGDRQGGGEQ